MGGWICLVGDASDFDLRLARLKKIFSIEGVPDLHLEIFDGRPGIMSLFWAWSDQNIPDVYLKSNSHALLILCGVITELGPLSALPSMPDQTAQKVLDLWSEKGESIIPEMNGSFSCLFYDRFKKQASVFVDRFASRSVWIGKDRGTWMIGNFPSSLAVLRQQPPKWDPAGLWSFFHAGRQVGPQGLYAGIRALMAGQYAILIPHCEANIKEWWKRKYQPERDRSPNQWGSLLADALKKSALKYKKVTERPYLFLSGGLDSRLVAASFKRPLRTLTLCTIPNVESRIASSVSQILRLKHQTIIRSPHWYHDTLKASSLISSGAYLNHHTHFIVPVQNIVTKNEASEFFLGDLLENFNKHYFSSACMEEISFSPENIESLLYSCVPYTIQDQNRIGNYFHTELRKSLRKLYLNSLRDFAHSLVEVSEDHSDLLDTFLRWANVGITPTYNMITCIWPLAKERNICFDNELNEISQKIPSNLRGMGILHKWILYHLCKALVLIPDANTFLPPLVPKKIGKLAKKIRPYMGKLRRSLIQKSAQQPSLKTSGSWLLLHEMYRKDALYKSQTEQLLTDKEIFPSDIFDSEQIQKTWEQFLAGDLRLFFEVEVLRSFGSLQKQIPCREIDT